MEPHYVKLCIVSPLDLKLSQSSPSQFHKLLDFWMHWFSIKIYQSQKIVLNCPINFRYTYVDQKVTLNLTKWKRMEHRTNRHLVHQQFDRPLNQFRYIFSREIKAVYRINTRVCLLILSLYICLLLYSLYICLLLYNCDGFKTWLYKSGKKIKVSTLEINKEIYILTWPEFQNDLVNKTHSPDTIPFTCVFSILYSVPSNIWPKYIW